MTVRPTDRQTGKHGTLWLPIGLLEWTTLFSQQQLHWVMLTAHCKAHRRRHCYHRSSSSSIWHMAKHKFSPVRRGAGATPPKDGTVKRQQLSYWSWTPIKTNTTAPTRFILMLYAKQFSARCNGCCFLMEAQSLRVLLYTASHLQKNFLNHDKWFFKV